MSDKTRDAERRIREALHAPGLVQEDRASLLTDVLSELNAQQTAQVVDRLRPAERPTSGDTLVGRVVGETPEAADHIMEELRRISALPKRSQPSEIRDLLDAERALYTGALCALRERNANALLAATQPDRLQRLEDEVSRLNTKLSDAREELAFTMGVKPEHLDLFGALLACFGAAWTDTARASASLDGAFHLGSLRPAERLRTLAGIGNRLRALVGPSTTDRGAYARRLHALVAHPDQAKSFDLYTRSELSDIYALSATVEGEEFFNMYALALARAHAVAEWTRTGHNVFELTHALAVGLALTDAPDDAVESSPLPYPAMVFRVPPGVLPFRDGELWVDTIWVAEYEGEVEGGGGVTVRQREIVTLHNGVGEDGESEAARNIVSNFLLWLEATGGPRAHKQDTVPPKLAAKRERSGETWPREWVFGREVQIAPEMKRAAAERQGVAGWKVRARFIVRGHWRNQAHGPKRSERRRKWIQPHWKGPSGEAAWSHLYVAK